MIITLRRLSRQPNSAGRMYIDNAYICDTLEPPSVGKYKRIPQGHYKVRTDRVSPKFGTRSWAREFGGRVPWITGVEGREYILIHVGNIASGYGHTDTIGCVLVGTLCDDGQSLKESVVAYRRLLNVLISSKSDIYIRIIDDD